jgi:hypothetical protein
MKNQVYELIIPRKVWKKDYSFGERFNIRFFAFIFPAVLRIKFDK